MEYYGKILCISARDLTRDDIASLEDGSLDPIMSKAAYDKMVSRMQINVVRPGKGLGHYALVELDSIPDRYKAKIKAKYGDMSTNILRDHFGSKYTIDVKAREFYSKFRFEDGSPLPAEHIKEYTVNASVLTAVVTLMSDTKAMRASMQSSKINWGEMAGAIGFYQAEFGHTLPLSPNRFQKKVREFQKTGYESLISRKFRNQNTRKVSLQTERLILSLDSLPQRPFNTTVAEMYNMFVRGEIDVIDPRTGEIYDPADFADKNGDPLELSETTIANYLNNPKNKALRAKLHSTQWDFNAEYRPHHMRNSPEFAFSKISMDDRDLPRKMPNGQRVKAYYACDVASGCVIGYSYSKLKDKDLFLDCVRNMFRVIDRNGWCMPGQVEVEHHLVNKFSDGLMKAGIVFPFVRWCNPGNSQEKRAEHMNRAKKYGVEKKNHVGIGRWYAALEVNKPKIEKVYDELNNTYKEPTYSYEDIVADDLRDIQEYNNMPHPNQKKYPGMSRWAVLCATQNPHLAPVDKALLYRFIGEHVKTSIRRNMYCKVNYKEYCLPDPQLISRLDPRNYEVDAYYLPDSDGNVPEVYIYQNDAYIAACDRVERYNEATIEQTQKDIDAYTEQSKYVARFDAMMKEEKITKVVVMKKEDTAELMDIASRPVETATTAMINVADEDDFSEYMNPEFMKTRGIAAL